MVVVSLLCLMHECSTKLVRLAGEPPKEARESGLPFGSRFSRTRDSRKRTEQSLLLSAIFYLAMKYKCCYRRERQHHSPRQAQRALAGAPSR